MPHWKRIPWSQWKLRTYRMPWGSRFDGVQCVISRSAWWLTRRTKTGLVIGSLAGVFRAGHASGQVDELQAAYEVIMQRRKKAGSDRPTPPHADYADLLETYPQFAAWMTDATFEDGEPRLGGWFCVMCQAGSWKALLKDNAEMMSLHVSAPTWGGLLGLIEHSLLDPATPWRHESPPKDGKSKPKK